MARRPPPLLEQIAQAALDDTADITGALRKCVALGGQSGSEELRTWATRELKGYNASDQLPDHRTVGAPIALDGATFNAHVSGQQISPSALPEPMCDHIKEEVDLRMPLAEIIEAVKTANGNVVRMSLPGGADIARLMNYKAKQQDLYLVQQITRLYWEVHVSSLLRTVDVVRTTLVELVAEIRAGTPAGRPTHQGRHRPSGQRRHLRRQEPSQAERPQPDPRRRRHHDRST
jgi:hypothetical protein